ncbi:major royal jelly protein 1-like [Diprion similis]|uniref:major royal jelly protein 1-like n=1 Tax=Diprion similis TaxID=362088 RepID=UPI001EF8E24C|nr:major royal jelly protein 1-like [Diprion similis]
MPILTVSHLVLTILLPILDPYSVILEAFAWNFSTIGLPQNVPIWRFTIWRNKAYFAVPRWDKTTKVKFTLLEAAWPEFGNPLQLATVTGDLLPFPDSKSQQEGVCKDLQSVTGLDSDGRGRLWILDAPTRSHQCSAKIVVFDLRRNEKVAETELQNISPRDLKCLVVDPIIGQRGFQAYVSDPGGQSIIVYSLTQRTWWKLKLSSEPHIPKIFITDLAISRKSPIMYLTGYQSDDLFSIDLDSIRNEGVPPAGLLKNESLSEISVARVGSKMGSSSGLICDLRGGLHYFLVTEIASVRWDSRLKLEAEGHRIQLQSETIPSITDYALDSQKNVWAIVNERHPLRGPKHSEDAVGWKNRKSIKQRTIKVYKYKPFVL